MLLFRVCGDIRACSRCPAECRGTCALKIAKAAMTNMSLDLIICSYNRARQLDDCLTTLASQTAPHECWRVTVVDNASTDETSAVVDRHVAAGHLPALTRILETRQGLQEARRRGLTSVSGQWAALVDDDCHLDPGWVTASLAAIKAAPDAGALGGRVVVDWGGRVPGALRRNGWLFAQQDHGSAPREVTALVGTGLVLRREALKATGWMKEPLVADRIGRDVTSGGDVEITQRLLSTGHPLRYDPGMVLRHQIDRVRLERRGVLRLSGGLGFGAAVIRAMEIIESDLCGEAGKTSAELSAWQGMRLRSILTGRSYDWRIHDAFLRGEDGAFAKIAHDQALRNRILGALRRDLR